MLRICVFTAHRILPRTLCECDDDEYKERVSMVQKFHQQFCKSAISCKISLMSNRSWATKPGKTKETINVIFVNWCE